jgi:Rieske Fe-S protein
MTDETPVIEGGPGTPIVRQPSRRTLLRGAILSGVALPVLAACGGSDDGSSGGGSGGDDLPLPKSQVPEGGGIILDAEKIVITQPTPCDFKAFSAVCTHQGCLVDNVSDGTINCPCHGSKYAIEDGSVVDGPAPRPLPPKKVTVKGKNISVA